MFKYLISEKIKIRRTLVKKLTFIAPAFIILISALLAVDYFQIDIYNWWYAIILPEVIPLISALLSKVDGKMKDKAVSGLSVDLKKVWISKVIIGVMIIASASMIIFCAAQLSIYFMPFTSVTNIPMITGFIGTMIIIITSMWQIPLYMFISRKIGLFPTVISGMAVSILSIITAVSRVCILFPFSYASRLMCPILKILPNGLMALPESQTYTPELMDISSIPYAIAVSLILFIVIGFMTARWYEKIEVK